MKILMLAPLPPPSGGIASWTVRFRDFCTKNDIALKIINIAMIGKRATVETLKRNYFDEIWRTKRILSELRRSLSQDEFDVVHINTSCSKFGVLRDAICLAIIGRKVPSVVHCRCNIEDQLKGKLAKKAFAYLVKKSKAVIVLNRFSKQYVDAIQPDKAILIPNFVNDAMILTDRKINEEVKTIISVGHVEAEKGLYEIVETAKRCPQYSFVLVGAIREDISSLKTPGNVSFSGRKDQEEIQQFLSEADIFLFPSKTEGFSNALLEAMAKGLPVIASDVGANKEMIENMGGVLLDKNAPEHIVEAIEKLLSPQIRKEMSAWNINKVKSSYRMDVVLQQYFELYKRIMTNRAEETKQEEMR